jgi:hypothetical protein
MADDLLVDGTQKEIQYICTIQSKNWFQALLNSSSIT